MKDYLKRRCVIDLNGCWIWTGSRNRQGYGIIEMKGQDGKYIWNTHRASWTAYNGRIPSGQLVLHRCDVPACINPDHLFLGTQKENMDDMKNKGRARRDEGGRPYTFSDEVMRAAVESKEPAAAIAARLGIHRATVHRWRALAKLD